MFPYTAFISYSSAYREWVAALQENLEDTLADLGRPGQIILDQIDLDPGRSWVAQLSAYVDQAAKLVLVVTPEAIESPRVGDEWQALVADRRAWNQGQLLPAMLVWAPLPLFWTAGLTTALGPTLAGGGTFVLQEVFDAGDALRLMARERVTEPYVLPHQGAALAEHPDWETTDLSSLREIYGKSVFHRHPSVDGDPAWMAPAGFGMSETCATVIGKSRAKLGYWGTYPNRRLAARGARSSTRRPPDCGCSRPSISFSSVLLPPAFGPTIPRNSPSATCRLILDSVGTLP